MGDDADILERCLRHANRQFQRNTANILFLAPQLRTPVYQFRDQLIHAFYGRKRLTVPIDMSRGGAAGPMRSEFSPEGHFLKVWGSEERPRFSRVGAVVCVEEEIRESSDPPFVPRVLVLHNPYARNPLPENPWSSFTQLVRRGDGMVWTDKE